jgi:imidazole glycerol phosphate synthase subunit HisF
LFNRTAKNLGIANKATKRLDFVHSHSESFGSRVINFVLGFGNKETQVNCIWFNLAAQRKISELRTKNLKWSGSCSTAIFFDW